MSVTATGTENLVREAASLIVVAKDVRPKRRSAKFNPREYSIDLNQVTPNEDVKADYQLLMTKRSGKSSYLASAYVFPGGHVDVADFQAENAWTQLFSAAGLQSQLTQLINRNTQPDKPRILSDPLILQRTQMESALAPEIAFRITAIRETFEETGVLIAIAAPFLNDFKFEMAVSNVAYNNEELNEKNLNFIEELCKKPEVEDWRNLVKKDANNFYKFCAKFSLVPNVFALHEWWNWSTPVTLGHKLFDTILYVTFLQRKLTSTVDNSEVCQIEWLTPEEMLQEHLEAKAFIAPPQIYELSRLASYRDYLELKQFTIRREKLGIRQWSYYINGLQDGALLALPGDDKYPQDGNMAQQSSNITATLQEMRQSSKNVNRIELKVPVAIAYCNTEMPCGQVAPVTYDQARISKL